MTPRSPSSTAWRWGRSTRSPPPTVVGVLSLLELALAPHLETLVEAAAEEEAQEEEDFDEEALLRMVAAGDLDTREDTKETPFADLPIKFAIVGRPNVGKSTLTNRMLGEDRVIVYDMPGTTRDSVYIPMERDEQKYVVIDTAGVRRRGKVHETVEKFSVIKTLESH